MKRFKNKLEWLRFNAAQSNLADARGRKLIFEYYKQAGYLPAKDAQGHTFKSFEDLVSYTQRRVNSLRKRYPNKSDGELLRQAQAGLVGNRSLRNARSVGDLLITKDTINTAETSKTVKGTGYIGPPLVIDKGVVRLDKRGYMSAEKGGLPPPVYDEIAARHGVDVADNYQKAVIKEWKDMNAEARRLGDLTGVEFHRGHWLANKYGGAESARAGSLEIGKLNSDHGAADRGDITRVQETGRASNGWLDDFYQWDLSNQDLDVSGVRHLNQADLQAISNGVDPNRLIAQRELEFMNRGGVPADDSIGMIFGSQLGRDQTIAQQSLQIREQNLREGKATGINPQTGNPLSAVDEVDLSRQVSAGIRRNNLAINQPKNPLAAVPTGARQLAEHVGSMASINKMPIRGGITGGLASGAVLGILMGESPAQAIASNIPILSDIESDNNGMAERVGQQMFVDPRTNRLMPTSAEQIGKGLAYLNGKPIAVPYGSVAGTKSNGDILKETVGHIADVNRKRVNKVAKAAKPALRTAAQLMPKPLQAFQPLVDAYRGFNKIINSIIRD